MLAARSLATLLLLAQQLETLVAASFRFPTQNAISEVSLNLAVHAVCTQAEIAAIFREASAKQANCSSIFQHAIDSEEEFVFGPICKCLSHVATVPNCLVSREEDQTLPQMMMSHCPSPPPPPPSPSEPPPPSSKEGQAAQCDAGGDYNWTCYISNYADLRKAFGNNVTAAKAHFASNGYTEGRTCSCAAVVAAARCDAGGESSWQCYLDNYLDLKQAFDNNNFTAARDHFISQGFPLEGRTCSCAPSVAAAQCETGGAYSWQCYLDNYPDLKRAFGTDLKHAKDHFMSIGFTKEDRTCACPRPPSPPAAA